MICNEVTSYDGDGPVFVYEWSSSSNKMELMASLG
jgi:hypothetical protein